MQNKIFIVPLQSLSKGKHIGELAEWSNAAVLKTVDLNGSGGSNPSLSAKKWLTDICRPLFIYSIPKNIPKLSRKRKFLCRKLQDTLLCFVGMSIVGSKKAIVVVPLPLGVLYAGMMLVMALFLLFVVYLSD